MPLKSGSVITIALSKLEIEVNLQMKEEESGRLGNFEKVRPWMFQMFLSESAEGREYSWDPRFRQAIMDGW